MMANFEVAGISPKGKRVIRYYALLITAGITMDLYEKFKRMGYTDISVRMI